MDLPDRLTQPTWRVGDIIRNKLTSHPYRVIHIHKFMSTVLIDLYDNSDFAECLILLPRNYDKYCVDRDVVLNKSSELEYKPVHI